MSAGPGTIRVAIARVIMTILVSTVVGTFAYELYCLYAIAPRALLLVLGTFGAMIAFVWAGMTIEQSRRS